jgi:outer membrane receptor protein involved in Fe transport
MFNFRKSLFLALLVGAFLLVSPSTLLHAQYENGSVLGTIRDTTGAPIPGADVSILNVETGVSQSTKTDGAGNYDVPQLRVGVYTITATFKGFSRAVAEKITVSVGNRQHIDLSLKVGATETSVEVSGVDLQIETESSQRDQIITNEQSEALPLVSRNYTDLLGLVAGVRQAPTAATTSSNGNSLTRLGSYNVNGQRSVFNNFLLDGMDNNSYGESNQGFDNQIISVPPDSVAQFSVVTNNESAEYGRSSGATINVASQSGGNRVHATAYEFIRNTDLNAAGFFKPTLIGNSGFVVPFRKPTTNRNQFGGNVGGPILRDKAFFFLDYEGLRAITKPLFVLTLPTQNELNGIFVVPIVNPLTGVLYPAGTEIPTSAINPLSQQIVAAFKNINGLPVSGAAANGQSTDDYSVQIPFRDYADKGDLRLDYVPNSTSRYFLRVSDRKETGTNFPTIPLPLEGQTAGPQRILDQQVAIGYTGTFGSNKVLDLRLGISKTKAGKTPISAGTTPFNIPGLPTAPSVAGGLPAIGISGFTGFGRQTTNPQFQNPALIDPKANYTWIKGNHALKFGFEYEKVWMGVLDNNPLYGQFSYGGGFSACPVGKELPDGNECSTAAGTAPADSSSKVADTYFADFLFGTTSAYALANYFEAHLRQTLDSAYAQDDWKVRSNLTLNLGLRWEYGSPYSEQHNYISNFDPTSQTVLTLSPGAVAGNGITPTTGSGVYGKTLVNPDLNDFAPRVGFAYAPTATISIRGGFGTSYVHYTRAGSGDIIAINAPQAQFAAVNQIAPTTTNHCASPLPAQIIAVNTTSESCYVTADQGFPSALATTFNPATDNITWIPKNTRDSYVESYFLAVQRSLFKNSLIDVAYVGNHGLKLQGFVNGNQRNIAADGSYSRPFANWPSDITEALNESYSNYNSLQVKYEQRMVAGLTLLNSFTWEHSLDNASASLEGNTPSLQDANNPRADYAQSDYNLPIANITSLVYDLPYGRGRKFGHDLNPVLNAFLGGWQVSAINTAQAGTPFNITYSPNSAQLASTQITANYRGVNLYRPNRVAGVPLTQGRKVQQSPSGYIQYINYNAIELPAIKNASGILQSPFGDLSRNPGRTPALYQTDLDLNKRFNTPLEGLKVEFRSEFYNLFNHTNLYLPSSPTGTQGGHPSGGGVITTTFTPRVVQFGLKVIY